VICFYYTYAVFPLYRKKELISLDDLELPWQPLYELRKRIIEKSRAELGMYRYFTNLDGTLSSLILEAKQ
jgi:proteasome activator subunit 4